MTGLLNMSNLHSNHYNNNHSHSIYSGGLISKHKARAIVLHKFGKKRVKNRGNGVVCFSVPACL